MKGLLVLCVALAAASIGCTHPTVFSKTRTVQYDAQGNVTGYTETETLHQQINRGFESEDSDFHESHVSDDEQETWPPESK